ncbi:MAG: hypothetical protein EXX96DRAFT_507417 [Benjaminiella poitrasii]|nr:MAG: hypothetical protein EXX96DRAFT_507417 [Benjaminiella poitrasii]
MTTSNKRPTAAIIGAGISGICAFVQLQEKLGITARVFELNKDVGGVWFQNTYPGCRCDVSSHMYSYSFEMNPDWSQNYSDQEEILDYLRNVAIKHNMIKHTDFETKVVSAVWLEEEKKWKLEFKRTYEDNGSPELGIAYFDLLYSAMGTLSRPNIPDELKSFSGPILHSAKWDNSIDFTGKRVAIVGSGASAVQIIPHIASKASQLIAFQRSSPWIMPQTISNVSKKMRSVFYNFPIVLSIYRFLLFTLFEVLYILLGYPQSFFTKYYSNKLHSDHKRTLTQLGRADLISKILPKHQIGCKRGAFSATYYPAMSKNNVHVVNIPIKQVKRNSLVTVDGESREIDILILATGFKTNHDFLGDIQINGKNNQSLKKLWQTELPNLYKSTIIHGFPNLFVLLGPYSYLGHNSTICMAETQVAYSIKCIKKLILGSKKSGSHMPIIEPTLEAQSSYMKHIRSSFQNTVWVSSCTSWYKNQENQVISLYPNTVIRFKWELLWRFRKQDYVYNVD